MKTKRLPAHCREPFRSSPRFSCAISGSVPMRWLVVAHGRGSGERAQDFVIHRMKLPGTHCRDPRRMLREGQ